MVNAEQHASYWRRVYAACHLADNRVSLSAFLEDPLAELRKLSLTGKGSRWGRQHQVGITKLVEFVASEPYPIMNNEDYRLDGIQEHQRHHGKVTKYQSVVLPFPNKIRGTGGGTVRGTGEGTGEEFV